MIWATNRMPEKCGEIYKIYQKMSSLEGRKYLKTTKTSSRNYERAVSKLLLSQVWHQPRSTFPKKADFWQTQGKVSTNPTEQFIRIWKTTNFMFKTIKV